MTDARGAVASLKAGSGALLHIKSCTPSPAEAKQMRIEATLRAADRGHFDEADRLGEYGFD